MDYSRHKKATLVQTPPNETHALQSLWAYLARLPETPLVVKASAFSLCAGRKSHSLRVDVSHKTAVASSTISPRPLEFVHDLRNNGADTMTQF